MTDGFDMFFSENQHLHLPAFGVWNLLFFPVLNFNNIQQFSN